MLAKYRALSVATLSGVVPLTVALFLALVMLTKILSGDERIIYYHHEIVVLTGVALFLRLTHQPVLPYLDITVLGLGIFLACGRVGCLLVGCCHGRPCRWGVCYSQEHAAIGFTRYYVGIPLFPVQALESLWAFGIVVVGATVVIRGSAPGTVFASYIIVYGFGRFCFEFLRGDPDRPYFLGFSEAQWTSLALMSFTVSAEASRALRWQRWHAAATILLALIMAGISIQRRFRRTPTHVLLHPRHVREIAEALELALPSHSGSTASGPDPFGPLIRVACTSLGVCISGGEVQFHSNLFPYYALSSNGRPLTADAAAILAALICRIRHPRCHFDLFSRSGTVFHLLVLREGGKGMRWCA